MAEITLKQQLKCARRELAMRQQVYPGLVKRLKMTPSEAEHEYAAMQAIVHTLAVLLTEETLSKEVTQLNLLDES